MTVDPGLADRLFGRDPFKIAEAEKYRKEHNLNYQIEVDGGINDQTIKTAKAAVNHSGMPVHAFSQNTPEEQIKKADWSFKQVEKWNLRLPVGGPIENYPEGLLEKRGQDELWVGADKGTVRLCEAGIKPLFNSETSIHQRIANEYLVDVMSREAMTSVPLKRP